MRLRYHAIPGLPPLAWCARLAPGADIVHVCHGTAVETTPEGFVEGAWNGTFSSMDLAEATIVIGTGASVAQDRIRFVAGTDQFSPLFSIVNGGGVHVSNSPAFVLTAAGEAPSAVYPFYSDDLLAIFRQGLHCLAGRLRLASGRTLGVHYTAIVTLERSGSMRFAAHRACDVPRDYRSYATLLADGVRSVFDNAADRRRKRRYVPLSAMSRGYDSTATTMLAAAAGCREAFSFADARGEDPDRDSGAQNARALGLAHSVLGRWQYLDVPGGAEREFGYTPASSQIPLAALQDRLANRILVGGDAGDSIWELGERFDALSRPWIRFTNGLSEIEFRLRVGYQIFLPAMIAARHNRAISAIAKSVEMRPWSVSGDYDRPIPRRIAEDAGLPRTTFGIRKSATGHSHLNYPSRFSAQGLAEYLAFVRDAHDAIPAGTRRYWQARAEWRHRYWDRVCSERRRFVRSNPLQRRFPFVLNAIPIRIAWPFMFTCSGPWRR